MRVEGVPELTARLEAVQDVPKTMLRRVGIRAVAEQKRRVARKTGNTARTIRLVSVTRTAATTDVSGAGPYLESGTKAHEIRPRRAKVLRFGAAGASKTLGGRVRTGEVRRLGKGAFVFARAVRHPGTKAQPFMVPGAEAALKAEGIDGIVKAWNGAA
jgi:hypothetical protein